MITAPRTTVVAAVLACCSGLAGCAPPTPEAPSAGTSLAPDFPAASQQESRSPDARSGDPGAASTSAPTTKVQSPDGSGSDGPGEPQPTKRPSPAATAAPSTPATPSTSTARVVDGSDDVSGGLSAPPSHVDLVAASVTRRGDGLAVRMDVAAGLPTRKTGAEVQNLVFFADVDGDGEIDYEVMASLADDGWFPSRRHPEGATYGTESGVQVSVAGTSLTLRLDTSALGGSGSFRWAVGSEWGTYEQIATGTTAQDLAPDEGAADFPA